MMGRKEDIRILSPIDGDMLNSRDGREDKGCLQMEVRLSAPPGSVIFVNGVRASLDGGVYTAGVKLENYRNTIEVHEQSGGFKKTLCVYWLKHYAGRYRVSLDDNIWFLKDIAENSDCYRSVFDNPYLGFFKRVHEEYGTKVHLNIYYRDADSGFNLTQVPSGYKSEWKENADWLRLSFHALQDTPDKPYADSGYEEMRRDCEKVMEQIRRFAGEEVTGAVTTLHWGEATVEGCRALRDAGFKCQVGDFNVDNDLPPVSYYLDVEQRRHINRRFIWKDNSEDIIFFRSAIITDCHRLENIEAFLDGIGQDPHKSAYMDLLIHEQYFYPHYVHYQPDYREKVLKAVRWAAEKGYRPAFLEECVFG